MKKKESKTFVLGMLAGLLLLVLAFGSYTVLTNILTPEVKKSDPFAFIRAAEATAAGGSKSAPGTEAPNFTLTDVNGKTFALSDFRGNPVIIEIFSTWCGVCISETPGFRKLLNNFPEVSIISVDIDPTETDEDIQRFIRAYSEGYDNWIYARDTDNVVVKYGTPFTGTTVLIDSDGIIAYRDSYSTEYETLATELGKLGLESSQVDSSAINDVYGEVVSQIDFEEEVTRMEEIFDNQKYNLAILEVKGMTCPSCIKIIKDNLKDIPGVVDVVFSLEDSRGAVVYDSTLASVQDDIVLNEIFSENTTYKWTYTAKLLEDKKI